MTDKAKQAERERDEERAGRPLLAKATEEARKAEQQAASMREAIKETLCNDSPCARCDHLRAALSQPPIAVEEAKRPVVWVREQEGSVTELFATIEGAMDGPWEFDDHLMSAGDPWQSEERDPETGLTTCLIATPKGEEMVRITEMPIPPGCAPQQHVEQPERPNALAEWAESTADSWDVAPPSEINQALALAHRSFAKRARELQPPAPALSDEERQHLLRLANITEHGGSSKDFNADKELREQPERCGVGAGSPASAHSSAGDSPASVDPAPDPVMLEVWANWIASGNNMEDTNAQLCAEDIRRAAAVLRRQPQDKGLIEKAIEEFERWAEGCREGGTSPEPFIYAADFCRSLRLWAVG